VRARVPPAAGGRQTVDATRSKPPTGRTAGTRPASGAGSEGSPTGPVRFDLAALAPSGDQGLVPLATGDGLHFSTISPSRWPCRGSRPSGSLSTRRRRRQVITRPLVERYFCGWWPRTGPEHPALSVIAPAFWNTIAVTRLPEFRRGCGLPGDLPSATSRCSGSFQIRDGPTRR